MSALLAVLAIFLAFPKVINAQIVINEFSSWESSGDWVELYSDEDTDISGWILRDTASTKVNTISSGVSIGPSTSKFFVFDAKNRLNKDGDTIKLFKEDDFTLVDQVSYGDDDQADVCIPNEGQSVGRSPDGTGNFVRFISQTRDATNSASQDPCPTPTPTPTEEPAPTDEPTSVPTKKPTSIPTSAPTPKTTSIPTSTPSPAQVLPEEKLGAAEVLSAATDSSPYNVFFQDSTVSASTSSQSASVKSKLGVNLTLVGLGLLTLSGSVLFFRNNPY
ncbi:lamin tail domain-containing protein [Patescibacteria group bacterium]|nr:lamin tail domain-containing protein [Patescibacteria group bacterium]